MPQTTITLTITTPQAMPVSEAIGLFTQHHGYQELLPDGTNNPESKGAFAKRIIARQVMEAIKAQKVQNAATQAADTESSSFAITVD